MSPPDHILMHCDVTGHQSDREAWLTRRAMGIGASEVAAVLGISPWSSALNVYAAKRGQLDASEPTERMRWGTRLERAIIEGLAEERGKAPPEWPELDGRLLRSRQWPWMLATPDGWLLPRPEGAALMVELKSSDRTASWDELPAHIWTQVQAQMAVTGEPRVLVAALLRGNELRQIEVARDDEGIADIVEACRLLWLRVEAGDPPPPDGSEASSRALRRLYPQDSGESIALPLELIPLAVERAAIKRAAEEIESRCEEIDNAIKAALGAATKALLPDGSGFRWQTETRKARLCPACNHTLQDAQTIRKFVPLKACRKGT